MGRLSGKKPSPAMVTSIVALVFAVAGTSVAGVATISVLNKKEKKQTSKIAKKEIKKAAPGLSVANADKLDGKDASQLQTTSAYAERTSGDFPLTASFQEVVTTSVTTTGTRIVATASLELDANGAGGDTAHCRLRIAGVESSTYDSKAFPSNRRWRSLSRARSSRAPMRWASSAAKPGPSSTWTPRSRSSRWASRAARRVI